jgi:hypothetical protein
MNIQAVRKQFLQAFAAGLRPRKWKWIEDRQGLAWLDHRGRFNCVRVGEAEEKLPAVNIECNTRLKAAFIEAGEALAAIDPRRGFKQLTLVVAEGEVAAFVSWLLSLNETVESGTASLPLMPYPVTRSNLRLPNGEQEHCYWTNAAREIFQNNPLPYNRNIS